MSKISKTMKAELISDFFAERGKRMSNLTKVDVAKLDEIILQHSINIEQQMQKRTVRIEKEKEAKIQREKEQEERERKYKEEQKAKEEERLQKWNSINETQQMTICEKIATYQNNARHKDYEKDVRITDEAERKAIATGKRFERQSPTVIVISGIIFQMGRPLIPDDTKEQWFANMPQSMSALPLTFYNTIVADIEQMIAENNELSLMSAEDRNVAVANEKAPVVVKKVVKRKVVKKPVELVIAEKPVPAPKLSPKNKAEIVRPTYELNKLPEFNCDYTLFRHKRGGFCHYAVYNNTANHYVYCQFDGNKITTTFTQEGEVYPSLNAFTTANWAEQRKKDGNNKTTRNNAYRETQFRPLQMIDVEEMIYGIIPEKDWVSSMSIERK